MSQHTPGQVDAAIIGAGIAGLSAARRLSEHGLRVTVFDKGRGPGGRAARRRQDGYEFDHGAQYFTARDPEFAAHVKSWTQEGVAVEWTGRVVALTLDDARSVSPIARHVGTPGMSSIARHLARGLDVRCGRRVERVARESTGWMLGLDDGSSAGPFANVLVTAPGPQAARLLAPACPELARRIGAARLQPCWTTMLAFDRRLETGFDAAFVEKPGAIGWLARNSSKPHRPSTETWVVNARPDWSVENLERPNDWVASFLTRAMQELLGIEATPTHRRAHRWRYALVDRPLGVAALFDDELRIGAAGDWCIGARLEAAFLSGASAAERILV